MAEAKRKALQMAQEKKLTYINGYDHPNIISGQGTIGLEICEQVPFPDAVVVPVGGGGLIAGVATAIKAMSPKTKIIVNNNILLLILRWRIEFQTNHFRALNRKNVQVFQKQWNTDNRFQQKLIQHLLMV